MVRTRKEPFRFVASFVCMKHDHWSRQAQDKNDLKQVKQRRQLIEMSAGFHPNESFGPTFRKTVEEVAPVEFVGGAGDVIFLHPLMLHCKGLPATPAHTGGGVSAADLSVT